jgi:hypothetical protein
MSPADCCVFLSRFFYAVVRDWETSTAGSPAIKEKSGLL